MRWLLLVGLLLCICVPASQCDPAASEVPIPEVPITEVPSTEVPIVTEIDSEMFPENWRSTRINAQATPVAASQKERGKRIVLEAMAKYPRALLLQNLRKVYVVGSLHFTGISAGGTNSRDCVYIHIGDDEHRYSDRYVEGCFHQEFSSILLRNYPRRFPKSDWLAANPSAFRYSRDGVEAVKAHQSNVSVKTAEPEIGFVNEYAKSSLENDFNEIAEGLFTGNPSLWKLAEHPRVRDKIELAIKFYNNLDSSFTKEYFVNLCFARKDNDVQIVTVIEPDMFPAKWRVAKIDAQSTEVAEGQKERTKNILLRAMAKYPRSLLAENLRKVYVVGSLRFSGITAASTDSRDCIYLVNNGDEHSYSDQFIEGSFHLAFASILLRNNAHLFAKGEWLSVNPISFAYGGSGVVAVRSGRSQTALATADPESGFVSQYAKSMFENDFNEIAEWLFLGDKEFWELYSYPRIQKKIDLSIKFYNSLDSSFTKDYFLSLCSPSESKEPVP